VNRRWTSFLMLLLLFLGLGLYLWLVDLPHEQAAQESAEQVGQLLNVDPTHATALALETADGTIRLTNNETGLWQITAPVTTPADQTAVQTLLTRLGEARRSRLIDEAPTDLGSYGLDRAPVALDVTVNGLDHRIEFGGKNPIGSSIYARVFPAVGGPVSAAAAMLPPPVLLVPSSVREAVEKKLFDLRKKELLDLIVADVTALELRYADQRRRPITVERRSMDGAGGGAAAGWEMMAPVRATADQEAIEGLIRKLSSLRATAILDEGKTGKLAGLKQPRTEVAIQAKDRTARVSFYFPLGEEAAYAVTTPAAPLYQVDRQTVLQLDKTLFDLRDKRIAAISPETVQQIVVTAIQGSYRLERRGTGWFLDDQALSPAGQEKVTAFVTILGQAKVEKVAGQTPAAWPGLGLDQAATVVSLTGGESEGPLAATIRFGKREGELLYVRRGTEPESFITEAALIDAMPTLSELRDFLNGSERAPTADSKR